MLDAISNGMGFVLSLTGKVLKAIVDVEGGGHLTAVLPVIGLAIAMGIVGFGIKTIKSLVWGF